jgi:acyl-CoA reductase-like NAD-dependent aldehyde dehydrogenase
MRQALLLIDLQRDFLERPGVTPSPFRVVDGAAALLSHARAAGMPVVHVHTVVREDGADAMPHWRTLGIRACRDGTPGAEPPEPLAPRAGEPTFRKRFHSGFGDPRLEAALRDLAVDSLLIAGLFLEGCVRETVMDAYRLGFEVRVVDGAVGSLDPVHGEMTRWYLDGRSAKFVALGDVLGDGRLVKRNPSDWGEVLAVVPESGGEGVRAAAEALVGAQRDWCHRPVAERLRVLRGWHRALGARGEELARVAARDVGKPLRDARLEVESALRHVETTLRLAPEAWGREVAPGVWSGLRAVGVVGLITPWNNPASLAISKIAAALAHGNAALWKPSPLAPLVTALLMETVARAGLEHLVAMVPGGAGTGRAVIADPQVGAVSLTGGLGAGATAAALCARAGKPLQAELGGNNAAVVLDGYDVWAHGDALALEAFGCAGQRCTSTQRFVVDRSVAESVAQVLRDRAVALVPGDPLDAETRLGPLISRRHRDAVVRLLARCRAAGGEVLCGGEVPAGLERGCWLTPAVVRGIDPASELVQDEVFGPVVFLLEADGVDDAIRVTNGVRHGLVAGLYTNDDAARERFLHAAEAGLISFTPGPVPVDPQAPFGGWKASGLGPPEHGRWDTEFYTRAQAVYGGAPVMVGDGAP